MIIINIRRHYKPDKRKLVLVKKRLSHFVFVFIFLPYLLDQKLLHVYMYVVEAIVTFSSEHYGWIIQFEHSSGPSYQEGLGART
jgi:hypothetical protein